MRPPDRDSASVLVAVVNARADLERAREQGWYRIPVARAPQPLASDYVAFYLTGAFGAERWAVRYLAEVWSYDVRRRVDLIADAAHPRAQELYYRLNLGPVRPLERAVPALRLRRLCFVRTDLERLLAAGDVCDLWSGRQVARGEDRPARSQRPARMAIAAAAIAEW
ncbi:MAG: hypothetical protein ACYC5O_13445 [Anaerolineae bacterium]